MPPESGEEGSDEEDGPPKTEGPPDEKILSPEELDFTRDEKVEQLDEGKFVIGTEDKPTVKQEPNGKSQPDVFQESPGQEIDTENEDDQSSTESPISSHSIDTSKPKTALSGRDVKEFISEELRRTNSQYAYRIAAKTGDSVSHQQLASDDIGMAFDGLLMWYAQQVGADTSVEEALGILLAKSNIRIRYPTKLLTALLKEKDLSPDDSISRLIEETKRDDGLIFPPDA